MLDTILRESFTRVKQSLEERLNNMPKVWNFSVQFLLLSLSMIHVWMIRVVGIVQNVTMVKRIYNKEIVPQMVKIAKTTHICKNSIQPLLVVIVLLSVWLTKISRLVTPSPM